MSSYKQERDLAVGILRKTAKAHNLCDGCVGAGFALCVHPDGPGEDIRCDSCGACMCSSCHQQSSWTWPGKPTPDMAPVVRCRDCALDGTVSCTLARIERASLVFINHDPDWYCADGVRKEG